ncbi:Formin-binding protein 1-like [Halotydeus destructor]|nr:Formin-binding protein 1-like [Halotydeus destructor]
MTMTWGQELWDQYPNLSDHTHKGIEFLDKYGSFIKERCAIEVEYAGKLKRLVKTHQIKKKDEEDNQYSYCKAFLLMLQEITDLAGQHELIAENMMAQIAKEIAMQLKEIKEERKRYLTEGQRLQNAYSVSIYQLDKAKKSYEKAFKESEKALDNYQKADADLNLSRAEVEKARMISLSRGQFSDEAKTEYANQLQKTNELQRNHFNDLMPKVFQQLQDMEERRIACVQNYMRLSATIHRAVFPIIDKCLEGVLKASESISPQDDSMLVIERYKSGNVPPQDIPFEDLSDPSTLPPKDEKMGSNHLTYSHSIKSETLRGTLSVSKLKKRGGIFGIFGSNKNANLDDSKDDYAELPPMQRRKRLNAKIDQIQSQINQEVAVRDGLMKMKAAYESNPSMGDPHSVEGQLAENGHRMEKLHSEHRKFSSYLEDAEGKPNTPRVQKRHSRNSVSEDSLSRSASDSSVSQNPPNQLTPNSKNRLNSSNHNSEVKSNSPIPEIETNGPEPEHSPESGISTSNLSIPDADDFEDAQDVPDAEFDADILPSLGRAKALYPFEAQSEGSIAMLEGEEMEVVELDQGDGWTRVRRMNAEEEGFVPTSYIEVEVANC